MHWSPLGGPELSSETLLKRNQSVDSPVIEVEIFIDFPTCCICFYFQVEDLMTKVTNCVLSGNFEDASFLLHQTNRTKQTDKLSQVSLNYLKLKVLKNKIGFKWHRCNDNIKVLSHSGKQQEGMHGQYHGLATRLLYGTQGTIGGKREKEKLKKYIHKYKNKGCVSSFFLLIFHLWTICNRPAKN